MRRAMNVFLLLIGFVSVNISTKVFSQEESTFAECPGSPPSRLAPGMTAFVVIPPEGESRRDLRVRTEPGGEQVGSLSSGQYFVITGEPTCGEDGLLWWPIENRDGSLRGWSVEGFAPDDYMMFPEGLSETVAQPTSIPDSEETIAKDDPCAATPSRLTHGMLAYAAMPGEGETSRALRVRSTPGGEQVGSLAAGTLFRITGESECDSDGLLWWPILTVDETIRGWSAEALSSDNYLITPVELANRELITTQNAINLIMMDGVGMAGLELEDANNPSIPRDMAFSPDGSILAVAENDLTFWSMATGELVSHLPIMTDTIGFSPDGNMIAVETSDGIRILGLPNGEELYFLNGRMPFTWSPDGRFFAYTLLDSSGDNAGFTVQLWDIMTQQVRASIVDLNLRLNEIVFSPDSMLLAASADNPFVERDESGNLIYAPQSAYLWLVETALEQGVLTEGMEEAVWELGTYRTGHIAFTPDGKTLAVERFSETRFDDGEGLHHGHIHFLQVDTQLKEAEFFGETWPIYNPEGTILATITQRNNRAFRLWNARLGGEIAAFGAAGYNPHEPSVRKIAFSPDGTLIAVLWIGYFPISKLQLWGVPGIE